MLVVPVVAVPVVAVLVAVPVVVVSVVAVLVAVPVVAVSVVVVLVVAVRVVIVVGMPFSKTTKGGPAARVLPSASKAIEDGAFKAIEKSSSHPDDELRYP